MRCLLTCLITLCLACQGKPSAAAASQGSAPSTALATSPQPASDDDGKVALVQAELLTAAPAFIAGSETRLALRLTMAPGWHVYWRGANDTGLPLSVSWELPPGAKVGPLQWPAPERYVSPGGLLDHVYFDELVVLATLSLPPHRDHDQLTVAVQLDWLVCDETCLPGNARLELTLPLRPAGTAIERELNDGQRAAATVLARALAALPGVPPLELSVSWSADEIELTVPGAKGLSFFPRDDGLALADMLNRGVSTDHTLQLLRDRGFAGGDRLIGILEVQGPGDEPPSQHLLDMSPPPADDDPNGRALAPVAH